MDELEMSLEETLVELGIAEENCNAMKAFLAPLKQKSLITKFHYEHSIRVALLAKKIARFMHLDEKALFYASLLHDLGKCQVALETLGKTGPWNKKDYAEIKIHVTEGYKLLRGRFDFSAEIILWHHRFQKNPYPKKLPKKLHKYSVGTNLLIVEYGRILAIADVFDALHRANNKFGAECLLTGLEIKEKMFELNPDRINLIRDLYNAGILIMYDEVIENKTQIGMHKTIWENLSMHRTPRETGRHVMLAAALEPIADKYGCTTHYANISRHLKLEYFIAAGINIGEAFEEIGQRINANNHRQTIIYDVALRAQKESFRNRAGGRINHGIIELLLPIVASQHIYNSQYKLHYADVLESATDVLKRSTKEDVGYLRATKRFAYDLSGYSDRVVAEYPGISSVFEYYEKELENSKNPTSVVHNSEFVKGFPTIERIFEDILESNESRFGDKIEKVFRKNLSRFSPKIGKGFLADCVAVSIYLHLSQNPKLKLVI